MSNEANTCRKYVVPALQAAGWEDDPHSIQEQHYFTDGRIIPVGTVVSRRKRKFADYILRYRRDFPIAVVEAKAEYKTPGAGLQQAKDYAEILGLKFAYATNGKGIIEFDYTTGLEREIEQYPKPGELWERYRQAQSIDPGVTYELLSPFDHNTSRRPRYYQEIAINRVVEQILKGNKRVLVTMATGTGKTVVAFQICWKLWNANWNTKGTNRKPKILFLADRNILVDDPKDKTFAAFGEARCKIEKGEAIKSREIYFATYQSLARDERRPGLYREYARDFFDLIIIDECHRGSANDESNWREILEYFQPAYQVGMTATPLRNDNAVTYRYFGNPVYQYSLKQGIDDGFLAPYRVHRILSSYDANGWRPRRGEVDRDGQPIPDRVYTTKDFERIIAIPARTRAIAKHVSDFMRENGRFDKTIVFCVDQDHADRMRHELAILNADLMKEHPDYVARVTADEGDIGRGHLGRFQDPETKTPVILTTSQLLTTGVDAPTVKNVVLARIIGTMTEFKQIIGRGTRVKEDYGKFFFNILDYASSATSHFADPEFDGFPASITSTEIDDEGNVIGEETMNDPGQTDRPEDGGSYRTGGTAGGGHTSEPRPKYNVVGGHVEIVAHMVQEFDLDGKYLRTVTYSDFTAGEIRRLYPTFSEFANAWGSAEARTELEERLEAIGISLETLQSIDGRTDVDAFDLLCNVAYGQPVQTRRHRADRVRREQAKFFDQYQDRARAILEELLEKYAEYGAAQLEIPDALKLPSIARFGNVPEIVNYFGGAAQLRTAIETMQRHLYASQSTAS